MGIEVAVEMIFLEYFIWVPLFFVGFFVINFRYFLRNMLGNKGAINIPNYKSKKLNLVFTIVALFVIIATVILCNFAQRGMRTGNIVFAILFFMQIIYFFVRTVLERNKI